MDTKKTCECQCCDPAPYGYDRYGNPRKHWCTTGEHMKEYQLFKQICQHGTYYNPASRHYGGHGTVVCDRCSKQNLNVCIGYNNHDLCLPCVQEISSEKNSSIIIKSEYDDYGYPKEWHVTPF